MNKALGRRSVLVVRGSRQQHFCLLTRCFLIQKAKEASTVGILMGTLGAGMVDRGLGIYLYSCFILS